MDVLRLTALALLPLILAGCQAPAPVPELATDAYPADRHLVEGLDAFGEPIGRPVSTNIQVFRDKQHLEIVNATPRSYPDVRLWINQRYMRPIGDLDAGETLRLSLDGFYDERGERLEPGGFFRTTDPTQVWLVELEPRDGPLVGLLTIRSEER